MAGAPPNNDLAALVKQVLHGEGDQNAWHAIRSKFAAPVRTAIQLEWDDTAAEPFPPQPDLLRRIENGFWRMRWAARRDLPVSPDLFTAEITRSAAAHAHQVIDEYRQFQQLLQRCRTDLEAILRTFAADSAAEDLRDQVRERLWDLRHQLPSACDAFNRFAADTAREIAGISALVRRSLDGERRAMDELFGIYQQHMLRVCRSVFPEIGEEERKDILQDAMVKLLSGGPRTLDPNRQSTWRGFLRTVVFSAAIDWLRANRRYVNPAAPGTRDDV